LARGEQQAYAELYDACADRVHHYLVGRLGSRADADDVLQEAFVRLVRGRNKLHNVENAVAYVFTVARNEAARLLGRRGREPYHVALDASELFVEAASDDSDSRDAAAALAVALAGLPKAEREVVELKTYAGLTLAEIAEVTGAPAGTVATRYRTAVTRLRELLARKCRD
jgi:RNA polymerase sigma-70 factor (ECF subfamily)